MHSEKRLCLVQFGLASFITDNKRYLGGAERQMLLLSHYLKNHYFITAVVYDLGQRTLVENNGIYYIKSVVPSNQGDKNILNIYPFIKALEYADSDIYLQRGMDLYSPICAYYIKCMKRRYVVSLSNDYEVEATTFIRQLATNMALKNSVAIIVQNNYQEENIEKKYPDKIVKKIPAIVDPTIIGKKRYGNNINLLWIGFARKEKRPDIFLKVLKKISLEGLIKPHAIKAIMVMPPSNDIEYWKSIREKSIAIKNTIGDLVPFEFYTYLSREDIKNILISDTILVNTSQVEGFPNTFLEAWVNKCPVASLKVDPDSVITNYKCGLVAHNSIDTLVKNISTLVTDHRLRHMMGKNGKKYVEKVHRTENIVKEYIALFDNL